MIWRVHHAWFRFSAMKNILLKQNLYAVKFIWEIMWCTYVSPVSNKNPVAFPHGLSLLQNTVTIILSGSRSLKYCCSFRKHSSSLWELRWQLIAKHLGEIPEDVGHWQRERRGSDFQWGGWRFIPKSWRAALIWPLVSHQYKPRQITIAFITLYEITTLDNPFTGFCLNMIPRHVLKLSFPTRTSIFQHQQKPDTTWKRKEVPARC